MDKINEISVAAHVVEFIEERLGEFSRAVCVGVNYRVTFLTKLFYLCSWVQKRERDFFNAIRQAVTYPGHCARFSVFYRVRY